MTLTFTITGRAVPKGRPRAVRKGPFVRLYTPKETRAWEAHVAVEAIMAMGRHRSGPGPLTKSPFPLDGPLALEVVFYFAKPPSVRRAAPSMGSDIDNCVKAVADGLEKAGALVDDCRIVRLVAAKRYGAERVEVTLRTMDAWELADEVLP